MPDASILLTTTVLNTRISKFENKICNFYKYITNPEFNKLAAEIQEKLNSLIKKEFILQVLMDLKTRLFIKQHLIP